MTGCSFKAGSCLVWNNLASLLTPSKSGKADNMSSAFKEYNAYKLVYLKAPLPTSALKFLNYPENDQ